MEYKTLGDTGLLVSTICYGTMTFSGHSTGPDKGIWQAIGDVDQAGADALVKACFDSGINFFDTADVYSGRRKRKDAGPVAEEPEDRAQGCRHRDQGLWARGTRMQRRGRLARTYY